MKTLSQFKQAMKAPMYQKLNPKELILYKTGFKNGYRMSVQHHQQKMDYQLLKLKIKQEKFVENKEGIKINKKKVLPASFEAVVNKVCIYYEVNKQEVLGDRRFEFLVRTRSIIINLMIEVHSISLSHLARLLNMDHTTIIHHRKMKALSSRFWSEDKTIHEEFKELKNQYTKSSLLENYSKILITMSPIIPHFANECLEILGNKDNSKWPISIKELLVENSVNYVIQINGKKRAVINSIRDTSEKDLFELIKNNSATKKYIENKVIKKRIFIPNKLINIIL